MIESELITIRIFLVTFMLKNVQEKYLLSILLWKLILELIYKIKDLNEEK